jgi:glycosyl hydrolase family 113
VPPVARLALAAGLLTAATAAGALAACASDSEDAEERVRKRWQRGMNVTAYAPDTFSQPSAAQALRALKPQGTNAVAIVTQWYMDRRDSDTIAPSPTQTPSDASLLHIMRAARELGLEVTLKPHVDVRDGIFRGDISPRSREAWFASYAGLVAHHARLAREAGARTLVVGVELTSMARDTARFREVIAGARREFGGRLTYAANWSRGAERVGFWDALDVIGIDAYMPLVSAAEPDPPVDRLERAWKPHLQEIDRLRRRVGKRVVFTELGYQNRLGTAASPFDARGAPSDPAQQRAYEAALRVWSRVPWFEGIYWWDWSAGGTRTAESDSFTPQGRPAETTLRRWYGVAAAG